MTHHYHPFPLLPLVAAVWLGLMASCTRVQYVPIEYVSRDTVRLTKVRTDSIVRTDSVWRDRYQRGDTVYITQTAVRYRDRVSLRHDTLWRTRIDTVPAVPAKLSTMARADSRKARHATWLKLLVAALGFGALMYLLRDRRGQS